MLELTGVMKKYPNQRDAALDGIDLTIGEGEFVGVLGRSGAGKSTLIRCINRLVEPDAGQIRWNGRSITAASRTQLRAIRGDIGMIFQHFNLLPRVSVLHNVIVGRFALMPYWRALLWTFTKADRMDAQEALRRVGLEHLAARRVDELSGGQRQRVAIARVLMQRPKLLLGDEPISSLDPVTAERMMSFIAMLHREQRMTVVLNLHDVTAAKTYAKRIIGLAGGRIVFDGPPEALGKEELRTIYPPDADDESIPLTIEEKG